MDGSDEQHTSFRADARVVTVASEASRSRDTLSHDLNTSMHALRGGFEILLSGGCGALPASALWLLEQMRDAHLVLERTWTDARDVTPAQADSAGGPALDARSALADRVSRR